ncbi:uncharacterized protein LOC112054145 isoform X1 [Bicyclus anynana]|uniref:Uncharacterized protein LOC112054145 isoform X1 n=1 Tax=Bicyclus anynana TaxID=110368 RepID=A0ABM3M2E7_BICAN|nr:uncharacterized protein LOC112054145 isoform X1 [Bicyclus anynana]
MATKMMYRQLSVLTLMVLLCVQVKGKASEESVEVKTTKGDVSGLLFADELKQIIERYMFGICPQPYKVTHTLCTQMVGGKKNVTASGCDLDADQHELAARLATLALRAHSASRTDCTRFGSALANTLGELARSASNRHVLAAAVASENKKRKLSKSQKKQIAAKQRTALAVKKKAAAVAAANAAKMATPAA